MRACAQCGLSIGEAATFCPVCGARAGEGGVATAVAPGPPPEVQAVGSDEWGGAPLDASTAGADTETAEVGPAAPGAAVEPEALQASAGPAAPEAATEHGAPAVTGPAAEAEPPAQPAVAPDEPFEEPPELEHEATLEAAPVIGRGHILDAPPEPEPAELIASLSAAPKKGAAELLSTNDAGGAPPEAGQPVVARSIDEQSRVAVEAPPAAEDPQGAEDPPAAAVPPQVAEEPTAAEEPQAAEEPSAAEEPQVADEPPAAVEAPPAVEGAQAADKPPVAEEPTAALEDPPAAKAPPAALEDPPAAETPQAAVEDPPAAEAAEPQESAADARERKLAELAALLEFAGRCEEPNPARAAVVYGEAVVGYLDVTDDPLSDDVVRRDLLRGFDRLSFVLERQGLSEEALAVVDDAEALGLLGGKNGLEAAPLGSLRDRRESLRRALYGDSAQL